MKTTNLALFAGSLCVSYACMAAQINANPSAPTASPTQAGPTTTTYPSNAAPQGLNGAPLPNGTAGGNLNASPVQPRNGSNLYGGTGNANTLPNGQNNGSATSSFGTPNNSPTNVLNGRAGYRQDGANPPSSLTGTGTVTGSTTTTTPTSGSINLQAPATTAPSNANSTGAVNGVPRRSSAVKRDGVKPVSAYDSSVTQRIREGILRSDLSMTARNVKVLTVNGNVLLRGQVDSQLERNTIQNIANQVAGSRRVRNETAVK